MKSGKTCGNCELLARSTTPGLSTYGKCPHRHGWVRAVDDPCEFHQGEPSGPFVKVAITLNLAAACVGVGTAIWMDVHFGTLLTHALLGAAAIAVAVFAWYVRRGGLFSEDAKYQVLERQELPPDDERHPPAF